MPPPVHLILALHNHQPVGNFGGVFEAAYRDSYAPFLELLSQYPDIRIALHTSGSLLEWLADHQPEYLDRLRELHQRGQVEILGGAYYEPILTMIPPWDRVGQIRLYTQHLEQTFGCRVRGMWVAERVWEQCLVSDLAQAGIEYTVLDDFHFKLTGLIEEQLCGYYLSEDNGHLLKIFPGSERLRYTIPFADPEETISYLAQMAERRPGAVIVFADDGEKFGTWPETKKHVYEDGWLRRFFDALCREHHWVRLGTLAEAVDQTPPIGKVYLPAASYREMTEWALPAEAQLRYEQLKRELAHDPLWPMIQPLIRGGYWRNFKAKYPEADEMYARMLQVSRRLWQVEQQTAPQQDDGNRRQVANSKGHWHDGSIAASSNHPGTVTADLHEARRELYRGQCNCAYWHGAFGGLYLPHLRQAVYHHLIAADNAIDRATGREDPWVEARSEDFNLDARPEVRLANDRLIAYLSPPRGGMLYELDLRRQGHNLLATLLRRPEAYHQKLIEAAQGGSTDPGIASIHERIVSKQEHLDRRLQYDSQPRKSLLDHFWPAETTLEALVNGDAQELGDFLTGNYEARIRRNPQRVQVKMSRQGRVGPHAITITKAVTLDAAASALEISYLLEQLPANEPLHFGVEFHFAGLAPNAPDRYFYNQDERLGPLESQLDLPQTRLVGLVDEWLGLDVALEFSDPTSVWSFPIQTVSNSEGGFELVYQSTAVIPHWFVRADRRGRWHIEITLSANTTAAEPRRSRASITA